MASWNYDPIIYKRRKGTIDDPFVEYNNVPYLIVKNKIFLQELPSFQHRVFIQELSETLSLYPESGKFHCDYNTGYLTFNEDINNTTVLISFFGTGVAYFPTSRIYVLAQDGEVIQTLEDFLTWRKLVMNRVRETYINQVNASGTDTKTFLAQAGYISKLKYIGINIPAIAGSTGSHTIDVTVGTNTTYNEEKLFTKTIDGKNEISIKSEIDVGIYDIIFDENIPLQIKYTNNTDKIQTGTRFIYLIYMKKKVSFKMHILSCLCEGE